MHRPIPKLAFYGDDFTGATDTLATVALAGQSAMLFLRTPTPELLATAGPLDCLGIAGAARSMNGPEQEAELDPVGRFFADLGAPVTHYKTCSTFDSSPETGNIGAAVHILRRHINASPFIPIVGGQPNLGRYCVFGNLFASFETGGEAYRIDRHPTMSRHPVTPMHESDLRLHLAKQGLPHMASLQYPRYDLPPAAFDATVADAIKQGPDGVLFDIGHAGHLAQVGSAIWRHARRQPLLAIGPSSVAQALLAHWHETTESDQGIASTAFKPAISPANGPVLILSGSMSPVTARQIAAASTYQHIALDIGALMGMNARRLQALLAQITQALAQGRHVLAYVSDSVNDTNTPRPQPAALAKACGAFLAHALDHIRPGRIGIAGGDTSSYGVKALDVWGLSYIGQIDPGAALCRMHSEKQNLDGLEIMLKGGQMGSEAVFQKLQA